MADSKLGPNELDDDAFAAAVFEEGGTLLIDMSDVAEAKFEVMPRGVYVATIDELTYGLSKSSGSPMFTVVLEIAEGEYAKRKLYWYASFSQKAIRGTKANLVKIDPELFSGQFSPQAVADSGDLLGRRLKIRVGIQKREDSGEDQNQVQAILGSGAAAETGDGFLG